MRTDDLNHAIIEGFLPRDARPVKGKLRDGKFFLTFTLGCANYWKGKNGSAKRAVSWIDCTLFGDRAPKLLEWLKKGCKVRLRGPIRTRRWKPHGSEFSKKHTYLAVDKIDFLGKTRSYGSGGEDLPPVEASNPPSAAVDEYGGPQIPEF